MCLNVKMVPVAPCEAEQDQLKAEVFLDREPAVATGTVCPHPGLPDPYAKKGKCGDLPYAFTMQQSFSKSPQKTTEPRFHSTY